jgi:stringent starvation protein B
VSVVDRQRPILRAFYEGCNDNEATIHLIPDGDHRRMG